MDAKVLIVDDDLDSLKLIGLMLQKRGCRIVAAQNGPQALSKAADEAPDLIMLDVMMPGMDGIEVCRRLRADPRTETTPIIMFSAKSQVDDKVAGFEAGADEYLTKPIHPAELVTRVEALLTRAARLGTRTSTSLRAKAVGFLGCKGGVGTTTLASNVAVALAQGPAQEQKVMLIEFRSGSSTLALQLGLRPRQALKILAEQPLREMDTGTIISHMDRHNSGMMVLSGLAQPLGTLPNVDVGHVEAIVRNLGAEADYLLVDMGTGLSDANQTLLRMLTYFVIVVEPQRVAMQLAQNLLASLDQLEVGRHRVGVIIMHKARSATTLTTEMAKGLLQREVIGMVSPAPELAFQAADTGIPMVMAQPDSLPARQFRQLAEFITTI